MHLFLFRQHADHMMPATHDSLRSGNCREFSGRAHMKCWLAGFQCQREAFRRAAARHDHTVWICRRHPRFHRNRLACRIQTGTIRNLSKRTRLRGTTRIGLFTEAFRNLRRFRRSCEQLTFHRRCPAIVFRLSSVAENVAATVHHDVPSRCKPTGLEIAAVSAREIATHDPV